MPRARISPHIELEYEDLGNGRPLLLIGGLGAQLISWDDSFCEELVARGYRVIRFDNRDSGFSTGFEDSGVPDILGLLVGGGEAPYALEDMARDAVGLLDHLEIARADVMGLSLGGMVAQLVAMRNPARVVSLVAALSGPPGRPSELPAQSVVQALLRTPGATFDERVIAAVDLRRALAADGAGFDEADARRRAEAQIRRAHRPDGTMRQAAAALAAASYVHELHKIEVPSLVIHGELDPLIPFLSAQAAAAEIPHATFVGVSGLGHDLPPAVALKLIDLVTDFHSRIAATG